MYRSAGRRGGEIVRGVPSWKPRPGKGLESRHGERMRICVTVVTINEPKRLSGSSQKGIGGGIFPCYREYRGPWPPGREQAPTPTHSTSGTWKPRILTPGGGKRAVRRADGGAGMGGRKKRMPSCNGVDKGPIPWHESALTSDWSFVARRRLTDGQWG